MLIVPHDIVAIDPIADSDKAGALGILHRPDQSKGRIKQGIVKYIGAEVKTVQIGDYVFFSGYAGVIFRLEGEGTLIFMPEHNINAILSKRTTDINGLYFYGGDGKYFKANYEQAMTLITRSLEVVNDIVSKERKDIDRKSPKHKQGQLFLIKDQEHEMGDGCFCMDIAYEFNKGICPNCNGIMHYASSKLWPENFYHCENMKCKFNSLGR